MGYDIKIEFIICFLVTVLMLRGDRRHAAAKALSIFVLKHALGGVDLFTSPLFTAVVMVDPLAYSEAGLSANVCPANSLKGI